METQGIVETLFPPFLILLATGLYGLVHSLLASLAAKQRAQQVLGGLAERGYRLAYNLFAVLSFLPVLALAGFLTDQPLYAIPSPWRLLTLALQGLAGLALVIGLLQTGVWAFLGLKQLFAPPRRNQVKLQVGGLYRWVRHPLYTAGLVFIWLTPIMTLNLLALNLGLTLYLIIGAIYEECKLVQEFGEAYLAYQRVTPMLIPRPPKKQDAVTTE